MIRRAKKIKIKFVPKNRFLNTAVVKQKKKKEEKNLAALTAIQHSYQLI